MCKYNMRDLDGKTMKVRDVVEHIDDYPIWNIYLLEDHEGCTTGTWVRDLKELDEYLEDEGKFEIYDDEDYDDEYGSFTRHLLEFNIKKHK